MLYDFTYSLGHMVYAVLCIVLSVIGQNRMTRMIVITSIKKKPGRFLH